MSISGGAVEGAPVLPLEDVRTRPTHLSKVEMKFSEVQLAHSVPKNFGILVLESDVNIPWFVTKWSF